jgi:D-alanyl-D-alanine carboxypeptidase
MKPSALNRRRWLLGAGVWSAGTLSGCVDGGVGLSPDAESLSCRAAPLLQTRLRTSLPPDSLPAPHQLTSLALPELPQAGALRSQLETVFTLVNMPAVDAALLVPGVGRWHARLGWADQPAQRPLQADTEFWWASCGKAVTASLVLQAEQAGLLSRQDRLSRWFSEVPRADVTLVEDLLQHTTRLLSYNHPSLAQDPIATYRSPEELLTLVTPGSQVGCPGLQFSYSNTNYLLLALILERVFAQPLTALVQARISAPLGIQVRALAPREQSPRLALAHDAQGQVIPQPGLSSLIGAGNMVGNSADWSALWWALLEGRLAGQPEPRFARLLDMQMPDPDSSSWYGLGVMVLDWRDRQGRARTWIAHTGGAQGSSNALLLWDPLLKVSAAVAVNGPASAAAVANALLTTLEASR